MNMLNVGGTLIEEQDLALLDHDDCPGGNCRGQFLAVRSIGIRCSIWLACKTKNQMSRLYELVAAAEAAQRQAAIELMDGLGLS